MKASLILCSIFSALLLQPVYAGSCYQCVIDIGPCEICDPDFSSGYDACTKFTCHICILGEPCGSSLRGANVRETLLFDHSTIENVARTHPRIAASMLAINRRGGVNADDMTVRFAPVPFDYNTFRLFADDPAAYQSKSQNGSPVGSELLQYRLHVRYDGTRPVAVEWNVIKQSPEDASVDTLIFHVTDWTSPDYRGQFEPRPGAPLWLGPWTAR